MTPSRVVSLLLSATASAAIASAHPRAVSRTPSTLVSASIEIDGEGAPLYRAPDGSDRFYVEAREGRRYAVTLANLSAERLAVVLTVDGLNAISGKRDEGRGRMYVLDPWQRTTVRGWRTSLEDVREFTFVDERVSYAARSGLANRKMGWIELAVYRQRGAVALRSLEQAHGDADTEAAEARRPEPPAEAETRRRAESEKAPAPMAGGARSYPGTGWGRRAHDPAMLVHFEPEPQPSETVTLRYEYRSALVALGVLPRHTAREDRLAQRDRAEAGFAQPPLW